MIHLAESAFSAETKLKANIFLIEKAVGKNYSALEQYKGDAQENELNINLQIIDPKHNIDTGPVSYTHLDVYKRQLFSHHHQSISK